MKKIIIIFFAFLLLTQSLGKAWIWIAFQVNKDYIVANLCENKAKPKMNCAGKCYLKKQLSKEASSSQQLQEVLKDIASLFYQYTDIQEFNYNNYFTLLKPSLVFFYNTFVPKNGLCAVFRPPISA